MLSRIRNWLRKDDLPGGYELLPASGADHDQRAHHLATLPHVPAPIPPASYAIALVEFAERASYYGVGGVFTNFIQRPLPPGGNGAGAPAEGSEATPGALGRGLQVSTALTGLFTLLAFTTPLLGGALADMRWGKFKTIVIGTAIAGIAHVVLVYAALPSVLQANMAFFPFLVSLLLLGGSTGLIKANIAPLMAEQYTPEGDYLATLASGDKVIVDREATIQRIMSSYYHSINLGAFAAIASTFAEKYVGFWLAYLIPGAIFLLMPPILYAVYPHLAPAPPPSSSPLVDAYHLARRAVAAKPGDERGEREHGSRDEAEAAQALEACKLFAFFAIYNIADGGLNSLMTSLAGSMTTHHPLIRRNPFAIVVSIPLLNKFVYPALEARRIAHGPVRRVVVGFILAAAGMLWCALIQWAVYHTSPCGYSATSCEEVSPLSAWLVVPAPLLAGLSESIAVVSALELAYTMSPAGLKSIVTSLFLFTQAISAGIVLIFVPVMRDPALVWPFFLTAAFTALASAGVWKRFKYLDTAAH
ncbi:Peptide transporter PTR2 [Vanrija pseudolonga]|uniref:Peptide transporter PTR2 n=1 Tax=Vanrija pseudolonga TaxID=143232 RepID=A0AAF0YAU2_9TREE|nr:Peptide transporter PTR2 [Vanrija pseudolonga]